MGLSVKAADLSIVLFEPEANPALVMLRKLWASGRLAKTGWAVCSRNISRPARRSLLWNNASGQRRLRQADVEIPASRGGMRMPVRPSHRKWAAVIALLTLLALGPRLAVSPLGCRRPDTAPGSESVGPGAGAGSGSQESTTPFDPTPFEPPPPVSLERLVAGPLYELAADVQAFEPIVDESLRLAQPVSVTAYRGTAARLTVEPGLDVRLSAVAAIEGIIGGSEAEVGPATPWYQAWPELVDSLAGRPVLKLYYGITDTTRQRLARFETKWSAAAGYPSKDGHLLLDATALYFAPGRTAEEATYLISTAVGLPDSRQDYRQYRGYTRSGAVRVVIVKTTKDLRDLAETLDNLVRPTDPPPEYAQFLARAREAELAGRWQDALSSYASAEKLLPNSILDPDPVWGLGILRYRQHQGKPMGDRLHEIIGYSFLAEEQGLLDAMAESRQLLLELADLPGMIDPFRERLWRRVAELDPSDGHAWWHLADVAPAALPVAESVDPSGEPDLALAAHVYLRAAALRLADPKAISDPAAAATEALRLLDKGAAIDPGAPFGLYLRGVVAGSLEADPARGAELMRQVLAASPGQPEASRQLVVYEAAATGNRPTPVETYSLVGARDASSSFSVRFSPDGGRLAIAAHTGGPTPGLYLGLVDRASGAVAEVSATGCGSGTWSPDAEWFYFIDSYKGQLRRVQWNGEDLASLASQAEDLALSPDGSWLAYVNNEGLWVVETGQDAPEALCLNDGPGSGHPFWYPDGKYLLVPCAQGPGVEGASPVQKLTKFDSTGQEEPVPLKVLDHYSDLGWIVPGQIIHFRAGEDVRPGWFMWEIGSEASANLGSPDSDYDPTSDVSWVPGFGALRLKDDPDKGRRVETLDTEGKMVGSLALSGAGDYRWLGSWHFPSAESEGSLGLLAYWGVGGSSLWVISPSDMDLRFLTLGYGIEFRLSPDGRLAAGVVRVGKERRLEIYEVPGQ